MRFGLPSCNGTFEFPDDCWEKAGMNTFKPSACAYSVIGPPYPQDACLPASSPPWSLVAIREIEPCSRQLTQGIPAAPLFATKGRLIRILRGFENNDPMPPIWIYEAKTNGYRYRIQHGVHRFYSSIAAGFTHIPAVVEEPFLLSRHDRNCP